MIQECVWRETSLEEYRWLASEYAKLFLRYGARQVGIIGSVARHSPHPSDLDLAVFVDDSKALLVYGDYPIGLVDVLDFGVDSITKGLIEVDLRRDRNTDFIVISANPSEEFIHRFIRQSFDPSWLERIALTVSLYDSGIENFLPPKQVFPPETMEMIKNMTFNWLKATRDDNSFLDWIASSSSVQKRIGRV